MATKPKPTKPTDPQQLILNALDRLTSQVEALVRTHEAKPSGYDTYRETVVSPRPTLKWTPLFTGDINWNIRVDPAEFELLRPGATITLDSEGSLSFRGLRFGTMPVAAVQGLMAHTKQGAKFHAYLTTARQVAVKVGYPTTV